MPVQRLSSSGASDARDRLLEAATLLFASHGYQAIGIRDIAGHLGLRAGSLYHHMESKQALLFELIESNFTDLLYETRQHLRTARTSSDRLQHFVQAFASYSENHPHRLVLMTREAVNLSTEQADQIERLQDEYTELLRAIVVAERRLITNEPKAQAREIARAILCMLCGQAHWLVSHEEPRLLGTMLYSYARGIVQATLDSRSAAMISSSSGLTAD